MTIPASSDSIFADFAQALAGESQFLRDILKLPVTFGRVGARDSSQPPCVTPGAGDMLFASSKLSGDVWGEFLFGIEAKEARAAARRAEASLGAFIGIEDIVLESANAAFHSAIAEMSRRTGARLHLTAPKMQAEASARANANIPTFRAYGNAPGLQNVLFVEVAFDPGSAAAFRRKTGDAPVIAVGLGEIREASAPAILRAPSLGSCVALVLYDSSGRRGVMAHVIQPQSPSPALPGTSPGHYGDTAVPAALARLNVRPGSLRCWIAGGANMFPTQPDILRIGPRNAEQILRHLNKAGVTRCIEDIGGEYSRTVELLTATGEVWVKGGPRARRLI